MSLPTHFIICHFWVCFYWLIFFLIMGCILSCFSVSLAMLGWMTVVNFTLLNAAYFCILINILVLCVMLFGNNFSLVFPPFEVCFYALLFGIRATFRTNFLLC